MSDRTLTLPTSDHGLVTFTCPDWCTTQHTPDGHRADITHAGTERLLTLPHRGHSIELLAVALEQRPYAESWPGTAPFVNVAFGGDYHPMRRLALHAAADELMNHAALLRELADELTLLLAGGAR